jgi:hypothetical protein
VTKIIGLDSLPPGELAHTVVAIERMKTPHRRFSSAQGIADVPLPKLIKAPQLPLSSEDAGDQDDICILVSSTIVEISPKHRRHAKIVAKILLPNAPASNLFP